jgi:hypothetical protein
MPAVLGAVESEFGELRREFVRNLHHDVDVVRQEFLARSPEIDGHAADDDRMYSQRSGNGVDHGDDLEGTLGQVGLLCGAGKVGAEVEGA